MARVSKKLGEIGLWAAVIFVAGYTGTYLQFNDAVLGRFISRQVTSTVRGTFALGHARYPYLGGLYSILTNRGTRVVGEAFEMRDPDGNLVLRVPRVEADIHLQELLVSLARFGLTQKFHIALHFSHVTIPRASALITPTRSTWGGAHPLINIIDTMTGRVKVPPDGGEIYIRVDEAKIGRADFAIGFPNSAGERAWFGVLEGGAGAAGLLFSSSEQRRTADGPYFFFQIAPFKAPRGTLALGDFRFPIEELEALNFGPTGDRRQDSRFSARARTLGAQVTVDGALLDIYRERSKVALRIGFEHGAGPMGLLPPPLRTWLKGDPHGELTIAGPLADVTIDGEVKDARVDLNGMKVDHADARLHLGRDSVLRIDPATGAVARGRVTAAIEVGLGKPAFYRARLSLTGVDPAEIPQVPLALRSNLAGRLDGTFNLSGSLEPGNAPIAVRDIAADLNRAHAGKLPKRVRVAGALDWQGDRVTLKGVSAGAEGAELAASGRVELGETAASTRVFADVRLDATANNAWLSRLGVPPSLRLRLASLHGVGTVSGPIARLEAQAHMAATQVALKERLFSRVEADVSLSEGALHVPSFSAEGLGAMVTGRGELGLFQIRSDGRGQIGRLVEDPRLLADLHATGVNLSELVGVPDLIGKVDAEVRVDGTLAEPRGHVSVSLPRVSYKGDPYQEGRLTLDLGRDGATIRELRLRREKGGTVSGSGRFGWSGALDLQLKPRSFPLAAIPGVSSLPWTLAGTLSGDVRLGGELDRIEPGGVISLVGAKIRETLLGDGTLSLVPGADAIAVRGEFFHKLLVVDGYLTLYPKLAAQGTVRFTDLELEKLFPEMQKLAEVRGRASGEARISFDADAGLTYAGIKLGKLVLTLSGVDEDGRNRHLVVKNRDDVLIASADAQRWTIQRANLTSTLGNFSGQGTIAKTGLDVQVRGQIGLELLEYFFRNYFEHTHGDAFVDLGIRGDLECPILTGNIDLKKALLIPRGVEHGLQVPSGRVEFSAAGVTLRDLHLLMDGAVAQATGQLAIARCVPGVVSAKVDGELSPKILQWIWPDQIGDATGRLNVSVTVGGTWHHPGWHGRAAVKDVFFNARRLGRDVSISSGTIGFHDNDIELGCRRGGRTAGCKSISGLIDDESKLAIDGVIAIGEGPSLKRVDVELDGRDVRYAKPKEYSLLLSPKVRLTGDGNHLDLSGDLNIIEGRYVQAFDLIGAVFQPVRSYEEEEPFWQGIPLLENLGLNLRTRSTGTLYVKNNIAELTLSAYLDIQGVPSAPRLGGTLQLEQGGQVNIPGCRFAFSTDAGQVTFDSEKQIPEETPRLDLSATGDYIDANDVTHRINLRVSGTINRPQLFGTSQEGWDFSTILLICLSGRTSDELRRGSDPNASPVRGVSASEGLAKSATGAMIGQAITDPINKITGLDTRFEFGTKSVDARVCKKQGRRFRICGEGELGFIGGSRVGGLVEFKLTDWFSALGRYEYLTRGVDTLQDSRAGGRLELRLRLPLFH